MVLVVMKRIAIIPARGGSKRIPKKNIVSIYGRPMLAWTIQSALDSGEFARVLVSTDCDDIAAAARNFGAEVPFMRNVAFDDNSPSSEATLAALNQAEEYWDEDYQIVAQLMPNCPMRSAADVSYSLQSFMASGAPAQISCFKFGWMNPWWAFRLNSEKHSDWLFPEAIKSRSQDLPKLYCPSGAIWIAQKSSLKAHRSFYVPGHVFCELSWVSAMDIDDADDLLMAKTLMAMTKPTSVSDTSALGGYIMCIFWLLLLTPMT
jgi:CMP-N-acetylneuraminic acid synthetase